MAEQTFFIGSQGPYFYDDAVLPNGAIGRRFALWDSSRQVSGTVQPGDLVVTNVELAINFDARTFNLTVTRRPLG